MFCEALALTTQARRHSEMKSCKADIKKKLAEGAVRAAAANARWTETRQAAYHALLTLQKPVTAYQLIAHVETLGYGAFKPASIYRALASLCTLGLAVRIESLNAYIACCDPQEEHQHIFLICKKCGSADEMVDHSVSHKLLRDAAKHGFRAEIQVLELSGACQGCTT